MPELDLRHHPCFNESAHRKFGRLHLPVAPKCNIQCRFCNRKYDCVNESRPGVTSVVLTPEQAVAYARNVIEDSPTKISVIGIAGPGDPLANPDETFATLRMLREAYPEILLCVATNGLMLPQHVDALADLQVSHVTVTINALNPEVGAKVYGWVREHKSPLRGVEGAKFLIERQLEGVERLVARGVTVKINSILIPAVNELEIVPIAEKMASMGATIMNILPLYPTEGSEFAELPAPETSQVNALRAAAGEHLLQMRHCARCRADAVGLIHEKMGPTPLKKLQDFANNRHQTERPFVAVATLEGVLVNQHLGESAYLWVYGQENCGFKMVDTRETPAPGRGEERWKELAETLKDCRALLVSGVGENPRKILNDQGIRVIEMEGLIPPALESIYAGLELQDRPPLAKRCGEGCAGNGLGCA